MGTLAKQFDIFLIGYKHPDTGQPLSGGIVYFYEDNTTTPLPIWSSRDKASIAPNPTTLDSLGRAEIYGEGIYKIDIYDKVTPTGVQGAFLESLTGIEVVAGGVLNTGTTADIWVSEESPVSFINSTSISIPGNSLATYHEGRRVWLYGGATGSVYGTIIGNNYNIPVDITSIYLDMDSTGLIDEALALYYSRLAADHPSLPQIKNIGNGSYYENDGTGKATLNPTYLEVASAPVFTSTSGSVSDKRLINTDSLNNVAIPGIYTWSNSTPSNAPMNNATMLVENDGARVIQMVFGEAIAGKLALRRSTTYGWDSWTYFLSNTVDSVTNVNMANDSVTSTNIANRSILGTDIAYNAIIAENIASVNLINSGMSAFQAQATGGQTNFPIGSTTKVLLNETFDQHSDFTNSQFTAPITGKYQLTFNFDAVRVDNASSLYALVLYTSNRQYIAWENPAEKRQSFSVWSKTLSVLADMDAGDIAYVSFYQDLSIDVSLATTNTVFSGYFVC